MYRTFLLIFLQLAGLVAFSQPRDLRFAHITTEEGLSQSNVTCILRDSRGFMWFGTRNGLNRYDGYKITVYRNKAGDPASLSNNYITSLYQDSAGSIWIATWGGGLERFDLDKERFFHHKHDPRDPHSLSDDFVSCITTDHEGTLWIGTYQGGLNRLNPWTQQFCAFRHDAANSGSISDDYVSAILEDSHHRLWAGTFNGGLNRFDQHTGKFTRFQHADGVASSLSYNTITALLEDSSGQLWVATRGRGLDLLDPATGRFRHFVNNPHDQNSLALDVVLCLGTDNKGRIWVGTENGGLSIYNPLTGVFSNYVRDDIDGASLNNNSIYSVYKDPQGNMWVGTFNGGVNLYNPDANAFIQYKHTTNPSSLGHNNILQFCEAADGRIWIGTDGGGADLFDPHTGRFTHFVHQPGNPQSLSGNYVVSVREDQEKRVWFGTVGNGITVYDASKHSYRQEHNIPGDAGSLCNNDVPALAVDKDGEVWAGTWGGGLDRYDQTKKKFVHFMHNAADPHSICSNRINALFADSKGLLWIGTTEDGLDLFDKHTGEFRHFVHDDHTNSLSRNFINSIFEDSRGLIWIGTAWGLDCFDRNTGRFTNYFSRDGLGGDIAFGIQQDTRGNIWVGTENGLSEFHPVTGKFTNYTQADGVQPGEFKRDAALRTRSGQLYFGGSNGFNVFNPDSIRIRAFDPPLVITGFEIFNQEVPVATAELASPLNKTISATRAITLSYKSSVLSFEFASLNYTVPGKKQYSYMLEGFDTKWNDIGIRRTATYTNLDPGSYVFNVRGLNNDGKWSEVPTSIRLTITPPFWLTWWFRLGVIVIIAGSVIAFYKIRVRLLQTQKKKLEHQVAVLLDKAVAQGKYEIASDVMHDIGNTVVGFESYLTRIRRLQEQDSTENLKRLADYAASIRPELENCLGEAKAGAMVMMLAGLAQSRDNNRQEINLAINELMGIIAQIQAILDIQRQYITGGESAERKPVDLKDVIRDSTTMLAGTADRQSISLGVEIPKDLPAIKGDRTRLMQVVLNVLKNSIDSFPGAGAAAGSGTGLAAEKNISIKAGVEGEWLIVWVSDSGGGFPATVGSRLFQRGFTTKQHSAGTGLYNSRVIMESHGGCIDLTSEGPGRGAVARIAFKVRA